MIELYNELQTIKEMCPKCGLPLAEDASRFEQLEELMGDILVCEHVDGRCQIEINDDVA